MITREFIIAVRAIFTVSNDKGEHYTFKVLRAGPYRRLGNDFAVYLLTGPDNRSDYRFLCYFSNEGILQSCSMAAMNMQVSVMRWALRKVWTQSSLPPGYEIRHAGRCGKCGRVLTTPESIETGIGPKCREAEL